MKSMNMRLLAPSLALIGVVACSKDPVTIPTGSPLAGLSESDWSDSTANTNPTQNGPGYFHGTVVGQSPPGAGNDSLANAPRIAGAVVTIYDRVNSDNTVEAGTAKASVTTGSDGKFTLPTLPAGQYVVTVVPPGNIYHGVYVWSTLNQKSSAYPWWIVLQKK